MKIQPLKIGTKTAKVPVIQGGMGVGISLGNLAGAVAKEGGIGIISAAQPGFREEDFIKDPLKANLRAIKSEYEKARKIASDGIIGFNLMVAMEHYEEYVHAVVEAGADRSYREQDFRRNFRNMWGIRTFCLRRSYLLQSRRMSY